jgi:hypothetical protein
MAFATQVNAAITPAADTDRPARSISSTGSSPAIAMNWKV